MDPSAAGRRVGRDTGAIAPPRLGEASSFPAGVAISFSRGAGSYTVASSFSSGSGQITRGPTPFP
jgi:hypothetical protein